ncbi:MAG: flippase-like domain-containing protein [Anaerolineales bacterium]|nr:flippase-like domain-containing protein [Anaerolineales bacterium]
MEKARNWLVGVGISIAALVIAFWGVRPGRFATVLSDAEYIYIIPAALMLVLGLIARARSWQILLKGRISLRRSFDALNEGYLLNNVLPLRLGELGRAYVVSRDLNSPLEPVLATVVVERLIDAIVSFIGLLIAVPFIVSPDWTQNVILAVGVILLIVLAAMVVLLTQRERINGWLGKLPAKGLWGLDAIIDGFIGGMEVLRDPKTVLKAAFWSLMAWVTAWVQIWLLLRMYGESGSLVVSLFVSGIVAFGAAIPSSPGAVGVYELSALAGLLAFDYSRETALSVAITGHMLQLVITSAFGAWALAREGETLTGLAAKTQTLFRKTQNHPVS